MLAQQIVAEVAATEEWPEDELFELVRRAAPYAGLDRATFDEVVELVSWGIPTGRGRAGRHLHRDGVNGRLRARRGARLAALTSGGAIPETGDYRVVLDPDGVTVGSVHEDFAVEANIGDVFLLGTHSWRVRQVEVGTVRVHDAGDAAPTVPFWLGEAPARTAELSAEVGELRGRSRRRWPPGEADGRRPVVRERAGVGEDVADQVVTYLAAGRAALGVLPTRDRHRRRAVLRRERGHPAGDPRPLRRPGQPRARLALRKRFCVVVRLRAAGGGRRRHGRPLARPQHSFPLAAGAGDAVEPARPTTSSTQAVLPHPMLAARWRWNFNRALVVPRSRGGQRRPIHLQRMEADDLLGRGLAGAGRLPGERRRRADRRPRPRAGPPDGRPTA